MMAPPPGLHEPSNPMQPEPYGRLEVLQWIVAHVIHFFEELELVDIVEVVMYDAVDGPTLRNLILDDKLEEADFTKCQGRKIKARIQI